MRDTGPVFIRKPADSPGIFKSDHPMKIFYNHPMKKFLKASLKLFGSVLFLAALWLLVGVLWPLAAPQAKQAPGRLLIKGATLVDVRSGELRPHQDILVESGEIIAVGNDLEPGDARLLQAQGQYVIPGMFDMHVHSIKLSPNLIHPLFVAAGVTAVRDMGGCIGIEDAWVACADEKRQWDRAVRESRMIGPRYDQVTSLAINGGQEIPGGEDRELGAPSPDAHARSTSSNPILAFRVTAISPWLKPPAPTDCIWPVTSHCRSVVWKPSLPDNAASNMRFFLFGSVTRKWTCCVRPATLGRRTQMKPGQPCWPSTMKACALRFGRRWLMRKPRSCQPTQPANLTHLRLMMPIAATQGSLTFPLP
jgi:hypothetical protein